MSELTLAEQISVKRAELGQLAQEYAKGDNSVREKHEELAAEIAEMEDELRKSDGTKEN